MRGAALSTRVLVVALTVGASVVWGAPAWAASPSPGPSSTASTSMSAAPLSSTDVLAVAKAEAYLEAMKEGDYGAQWNQLAPEERRVWPSEAARTRFLSSKFGTGIVRFTVDTPATGVSYANPENLNRTYDLYQVPADVVVGGVNSKLASYFAHEDVDVSLGGIAPGIVDEGPAAMDAPVIMPPASKVPARSSDVPSFMYHIVGPPPYRDKWTTFYGFSLELSLTIPPSQFAQEMAALVAGHYHPITEGRLDDYLLNGLPLPSKPVMLTFDDGRQATYIYARPILLKDGFPAMFYVSAGLVNHTIELPNGDNRQTYLTSAQISLMGKEGLVIGDHGVFDQVPMYHLSYREMQAQVGITGDQLATWWGQPVQFVAYEGAMWPYPAANQGGSALQPMFSQLETLGYAGGVVDCTNPSPVVYSSQPLQISRFRVSTGVSLGGFMQEAAL